MVHLRRIRESLLQEMMAHRSGNTSFTHVEERIAAIAPLELLPQWLHLSVLKCVHERVRKRARGQRVRGTVERDKSFCETQGERETHRAGHRQRKKGKK